MKVLCFILLILNSHDAFKIVQDHYWREYTGILPSDAIPGGNTDSGEVTYIGQFPIAAEYNTDVSTVHTLVATLYKGKDHAVAAYNGRSVYSNDTSDIKVLCASSQGRYKWYSPKSLFGPSCRFVTGGKEDGTFLYIGKVTLDREKLTGKVQASKLITPHQGTEKTHETYEILTYC
ncbi:hypothetical protein FQR65_LT03891 [Abscondita terminalis]|nr:hypothetical protein FQR65_LT03891 [Abscondita terminalis]